jgi:hypothetical protein
MLNYSARHHVPEEIVRVCIVPVVGPARLSHNTGVLFTELNDCRRKCRTARGPVRIKHKTQNSHVAFGFCVFTHSTRNGCLWDGRVVCPVLGVFAKLRKPIVSFVMSFRPSAWNNLVPTERIFICVFFENLPRKFKFHKNLTGIADTLHEDLRIFTTLSRWGFLKMRPFLERRRGENQNTRFMLNVFFSPESRIVYRVMWKNVVEPDRPRMTIYYGACTLHAG